MSEFKVGDMVKIIKLFEYDPFEVGDIGYVERIIGIDGVSVKFATRSYPMFNGQLELIQKKTFTISEAIKLAIEGHKLTNDLISDHKTKYIFFDGKDFMFQGDELEKAWGIFGIENG